MTSEHTRATADVWEGCSAERHVKPLGGRFFRVAESRHLIATRCLVDTSAEHAVLEALIERAKPVKRATAAALPTFLAAPFRYPPMPHGSRFGTHVDGGIWYGASGLGAAFAEFSHRRLLFFEGTRAALLPKTTEVMTFEMRVRTPRGLDLRRPPFFEHEDSLCSPTDYSVSQRFGGRARKAGVEAVLYSSARSVEATSIAVLSPSALSPKLVRAPETWLFSVTRRGTDAALVSLSESRALTFPRDDLLVDGVLPKPGL